MGLFRPDNSKRGQRCTSLANAAQLYYNEHKEHAEACEASAEKLHAAIEAIAATRGKTSAELTGLANDYANVVFEGGFEYHGLDSVGKALSFSQWFLLASMTGAAVVEIAIQLIFLYAGFVLARMADGAAFAARQPALRLIARGRAARGPGVGAAARALRWARFARYAEIGSIALIPVSLGVELYCDEQEYKSYVHAIQDLAPIRLDACVHALLMETLANKIAELATKAEVFSQNAQIASLFDLDKEFNAVTQSLNTAVETVPSQASKVLKQNDTTLEAYTTDDPDLTAHVTDLATAKSSRILQVDISSGMVVDWIQAQTDHNDGLRFGGIGVGLASNFLHDEEVITSATWKTGTLANDSTKKVIFNLTMITNRRSFGPFGFGGNEIKDVKEQTFKVPDKMYVCGLVDLTAKVIDEQGDATLTCEPYIGELRFVVAPVR